MPAGSIVLRTLTRPRKGNPPMWPHFEQALARYRDLEQQLSDPAVVADRARYARAAKEHGALAKQVKPYLEYKKLGIPAEVHICTKGGHGFGMRAAGNPINDWPKRCAEWMGTMGWLK